MDHPTPEPTLIADTVRVPTRLRPVTQEFGRVTDETLDRMCLTGSCWPAWLIRNVALELQAARTQLAIADASDGGMAQASGLGDGAE